MRCKAPQADLYCKRRHMSFYLYCIVLYCIVLRVTNNCRGLSLIVCTFADVCIRAFKLKIPVLKTSKVTQFSVFNQIIVVDNSNGPTYIHIAIIYVACFSIE